MKKINRCKELQVKAHEANKQVQGTKSESNNKKLTLYSRIQNLIGNPESVSNFNVQFCTYVLDKD